MAKQDKFKVSNKAHPQGVMVTTDRKPETLEEFESLGLVSKLEDVIDLAWQNLVIKMQSGARSRLDQGADAVQEYCDNYKYGARQTSGGTRKPTLAADKAKELKFTKAQLEALRAAGVVVPDEVVA